jgi:hypothetical protein
MASQAYYRRQVIPSLEEGGPGPGARSADTPAGSSRSDASRPAETASSTAVNGDQYRIETSFQLAYSADSITCRPALTNLKDANDNNLLWGNPEAEKRRELVTITRRTMGLDTAPANAENIMSAESVLGIWCKKCGVQNMPGSHYCYRCDSAFNLQGNDEYRAQMKRCDDRTREAPAKAEGRALKFQKDALRKLDLHNHRRNSDPAYMAKSAMRGCLYTDDRSLSTLPFLPFTKNYCRVRSTLTAEHQAFFTRLCKGTTGGRT